MKEVNFSEKSDRFRNLVISDYVRRLPLLTSVQLLSFFSIKCTKYENMFGSSFRPFQPKRIRQPSPLVLKQTSLRSRKAR